MVFTAEGAHIFVLEFKSILPAPLATHWLSGFRFSSFLDGTDT